MSAQLLGPAAAMPPVAIAQPLNDVQLVALVASWAGVAARMSGDSEGDLAAKAVALAVEITARAGLAVNSGALGRRLRELLSEGRTAATPLGSQEDEPDPSATA